MASQCQLQCTAMQQVPTRHRLDGLDTHLVCLKMPAAWRASSSCSSRAALISGSAAACCSLRPAQCTGVAEEAWKPGVVAPPAGRSSAVRRRAACTRPARGCWRGEMLPRRWAAVAWECVSRQARPGAYMRAWAEGVQAAPSGAQQVCACWHCTCRQVGTQHAASSVTCPPGSHAQVSLTAHSPASAPSGQPPRLLPLCPSGRCPAACCPTTSCAPLALTWQLPDMTTNIQSPGASSSTSTPPGATLV